MDKDCRICALSEQSPKSTGCLAFAAEYDKPLTASHMIVAPVRHVRLFSELTSDELVEVFELAHELSERLEIEADVEKVYLLAIGDVCAHFHVHVVPKRQSTPPLGPFVFSSGGWRSLVEGT